MEPTCYLCLMYKSKMVHAETLAEKSEAAKAYNRHVIHEHSHEHGWREITWSDGRKWTVKNVL